MMRYTFYFNGSFYTIYACTVFDAVRSLKSAESETVSDGAYITKVEAA